MSNDPEPLKKLSDATECLVEAARLHISLGKHATETAVSAALVWRYDLSRWTADEVYKQALVLLDKMPKN